MHRWSQTLLLLCLMILMSGCARHTFSPSEQTGSGLPPLSGQGAGQGSANASPDVVAADPSWFSCQTTKDCEVIQGVCGQPQALNAGFLQPFLNYRDRMNRMVDCQTSESPATAPAPLCNASHRCALPELEKQTTQP